MQNSSEIRNANCANYACFEICARCAQMPDSDRGTLIGLVALVDLIHVQ